MDGAGATHPHGVRSPRLLPRAPSRSHRCELLRPDACITFNSLESKVKAMIQVPGEEDVIYAGNRNAVLRCSTAKPHHCADIAKTTKTGWSKDGYGVTSLASVQSGNGEEHAPQDAAHGHLPAPGTQAHTVRLGEQPTRPPRAAPQCSSPTLALMHNTAAHSAAAPLPVMPPALVAAQQCCAASAAAVAAAAVNSQQKQRPMVSVVSSRTDKQREWISHCHPADTVLYATHSYEARSDAYDADMFVSSVVLNACADSTIISIDAVGIQEDRAGFCRSRIHEPPCHCPNPSSTP